LHQQVNHKTTSVLIEYKYVIVGKDNQNHRKLVRWENLETKTINRRVFVNRLARENLKIFDEEGRSNHLDIQEEPKR
jgi:hypothetical protein